MVPTGINTRFLFFSSAALAVRPESATAAVAKRAPVQREDVREEACADAEDV